MNEAAPGGQVPPLVHTTVLEMPGGAVHADGVLFVPQGGRGGPLAHALRTPRQSASRSGHRVRVSVARPDGAVHTIVVEPDGHVVVMAWHRPRPETGPADPRATPTVAEQNELAATATALEFQALAERFRNDARASHLFGLAAATLNHLGSPPLQVARVLDHGLGTWLRSSTPDPQTGYTLAHLLVRVAPDRTLSLVAVLGRLASLAG